MKLDAVAVTSKDLKKSAEFYSLLGFTFPDFDAEEKHLEPITETGSVRLMIDDHELIKSITGKDPLPANHSSFALKCDSPSEVDAVTKKIAEKGFTIIKEPWDAFWGQRYAIIADPDGYMVDIFAAL
ncbi:VOC family protein [Patescibacteria group bacterium]|nr:VOC family protein [Patescibacteria group bacterium]